MAKPDGSAKPLSFWQQLVLGVALATAGATGTYFVSTATDEGTICTQAAQVVTDDTPNTLIDAPKQRKIANDAADKFIDCMRKGKR